MCYNIYRGCELKPEEPAGHSSILWATAALIALSLVRLASMKCSASISLRKEGQAMRSITRYVATIGLSVSDTVWAAGVNIVAGALLA